MSRGVARVIDDSGKEEDEGVSGQVCGVVVKSEKVDLRVLNTWKAPAQVKFSSRVASLSFLSRAVIVDEKVCTGGHNDGH